MKRHLIVELIDQKYEIWCKFLHLSRFVSTWLELHVPALQPLLEFRLCASCVEFVTLHVLPLLWMLLFFLLCFHSFLCHSNKVERSVGMCVWISCSNVATIGSAALQGSSCHPSAAAVLLGWEAYERAPACPAFCSHCDHSQLLLVFKKFIFLFYIV